MENTQLRQLDNSVEIIGTLKSKQLEVRTSKAGNQYISGKLIVVSKFDNRINEVAVKVMIMEKSKLFKGAVTVMNEYKSIEEHGQANADRVKISGNLDLNEYYNNQGNLVQFNEVKGVFFNRLEAGVEIPDKAIASIDTIVQAFEPKTDSEGLPTGSYTVKGFTVGWGNSVVELRKAEIGPDLAQSFMNLYQSGSTGRLSYKLNNYVEVKETVAVPSTPTHGFGSTEKIESNTIDTYVNNLEIIGGDLPYFGTKEYQPQEVEAALQVRALKLQELQQNATPPEAPPTGFGQNSAPHPADSASIDANMPSGMNGNELPDF